MMNRRELVKQITDIAIERDKTCDCEEHTSGNARRLNQQEYDALRLLMSTDDGFTIIIGIIGAICANHPPTFAQHMEYISDTLARGFEMEQEAMKRIVAQALSAGNGLIDAIMDGPDAIPQPKGNA